MSNGVPRVANQVFSKKFIEAAIKTTGPLWAVSSNYSVKPFLSSSSIS
jgi:hypothetical protein